MKTQHSNLAFNKSVIVDLDENELQDINGGSGIITTIIGPLTIFIQ